MSDELLPWMKIYVNDFIGATVTWKGVASGLYAQLLILEWRSGPLPDDAAELASILRYDPATFAAAWATVRNAFELTPEGLVIPSLEAERVEAHKLRAKLSGAGKRGADSRWSGKANGPVNSKANGHANGLATLPMTWPMPSTITPTTTIKGTNTRTSEEGRDERSSPHLSETEICKRWRPVRDAYPAQPRKAQPTNEAWGKARRHCERLVQDGRAAWPSLLASARNYAHYCALTHLEPMSPVEFFGSRDEHWLNEWRVYPTEELDAAAASNKDARH